MSISRITGTLDSVRDEARAAIGQASQKTGVDFAFLLAQAKSESGLNPTAKAGTSSATGLYQFLDQSWLGVLKKHGAEQGLGWAADAISAKAGGGYTVDPSMKSTVMALREQPGPAALMAASYASDNAQGLQSALGRAANATDLYFAHFLGLSGASKFLKAADASPNASAASLFPREASVNKGIFYAKDGSARSLSEVYQLMGRKLASAGASENIEPPSGSLVATPPAATVDPTVQMAMADGDAGTDDAGGTDIAATLASIQRSRIDVLRPTPAQAKLAYMMLSLPMA